MAIPVSSDLDMQNTGGVGPSILNLPARTDKRGVIQLASQAEVNAGVDPDKAVTPATLAGALGPLGLVKKFAATIGDGTAVSIAVNHNLNTLDVVVQAYLLGTSTTIAVQVNHTTVNQVTLVFAVAPAAASVRVVVVG